MSIQCRKTAPVSVPICHRSISRLCAAASGRLALTHDHLSFRRPLVVVGSTSPSDELGIVNAMLVFWILYENQYQPSRVTQCRLTNYPSLLNVR